MRNRNTLEFLGLWEQLQTLRLTVAKSRPLKHRPGSTAFTSPPKNGLIPA